METIEAYKCARFRYENGKEEWTPITNEKTRIDPNEIYEIRHFLYPERDGYFILTVWQCDGWYYVPEDRGEPLTEFMAEQERKNRYTVTGRPTGKAIWMLKSCFEQSCFER